MSLDEDVLEAVAKDGSMDYEKWPALLDSLLERLDHICHRQFPLPNLPQSPAEPAQSVPQASSPPPRTNDINSQTNSNKENAPPSHLQSPPRPPPVPLFPSPYSSERVPDSQPPGGHDADHALPPPLFSMLSSVKTTLKTSFSSHPPHTIQRLAELILRPTTHYRTLLAYLRALDRVATVSSGADIFPLPRTAPLPGMAVDGNGVDGVNGVGTSNFMLADSTLGSDESLGGALLTPIPWLNDSMMSEEDHEVFSESEAGPVTQEEHSHQEREAEANHNTTLAAAATNRHTQQRPLASDERGQSPDSEDGDSIPHARGPSVLGVEDLGLQNGKGVEMTLEAETTNSASHSSGADGETQDQQPHSELDADADGDLVIADVIEDGETQGTETKEGEAEVGQSEGT